MKSGALVRLLIVFAASATALGAGALWVRHHGQPDAAVPAAPASATSVTATPSPVASLAPASTSTTPIPPRKTYPVGKWTMAVPYLNPFGAQKAYGAVEHTANGQLDLRYIDKANMETARSSSGELWELQVEWKKDAGTSAYDDLAHYVADLGGESWPADRDGLVVHARDSDGNDWWGLAAPHGGGYRLTVCKELRLRAGKPLHLRTADFKDGVVHFTTTNPAHVFQSLKLGLDAGQATLYGRNTYLQGHYRRNLTYQRTLYAYKTHEYTLDDLPQDSSLPIQWKLAWNAKTAPRELTVTLDEGEEIQPIHDGERLGALKVRGASLGEVWVSVPAGITVQHPELDRTGTRTPEGDTLFWLPSGYWNIKLVPDTKRANSDTLATRLVPVSAGQMTVLDVGPLLERAYRDPAVDEAGGTGSELRILGAAAHGERATVDFMLQDGSGPKLEPTPANTQIVEGGQPAKVLSIEHLKTPPSLVLVLDSSGSMRKSMRQVLASARAFIQGLPDDARVQLVDFDAQVRPFKGTSKAEALRNLGKVGAGGSTALYDAVLAGLKMLKDEQRPTLVVFTDGVDSREDHSGKGSSATKTQVAQAVADANLPLFTIGFGPGHDGRTLKELAGMSEGTYYAADDATALQHVFASINDRLGNRYAATYQRPREAAPSDLPVITLATDVSLSMDMPPTGSNSCAYCNYRFDKMKNLYHEFIRRMPANSLTQLISFSGDVNVRQVFTQRKSDLLQALGSLDTAPGTDILDSVDKAYLSLHNVPAERRVIVYLTDAALDVDKADRPGFEKRLQQIKADGVQSLWVGMGTGDATGAFKRAAELSGGQYVISEDPAVLAQALQDVLAHAQARPAGKAALTVTVSGPAANGATRRDADSRLLDFPVLRSSTERTRFDTISYRTGLKAPQYGDAAAALVYGRDIPRQDVILTKRLPLDVGGKNTAMEWRAHEMYLMKRFHGIDAPGGQVFMALDMSLKNIQPEGAPYLIPDFASHFFVTLNKEGAWPASPATWLAQTPLAAPGENSIRIEPDQTVHGALVFLVPDRATTQASADFYDTSNGHVTLPLIGPPAPRNLALDAMPEGLAGKLSGTFAMALSASRDVDRIEDVDAAEGSVFKLLEARFDSKVQADLKLAPARRFYLTADTAAGPFMLPVSNATARLPLGFLWPVTLAPGSSNKLRFAFQLPAMLKDAPASLYCDLAGGATVLPVTGGTVTPVPAPGYPGEGMRLTVNALAGAAPPHWPHGNFVVADVTIDNTKAGSGVSSLREAFRLVPDTAPANGPKTLSPDAITDRLLLGIDRNWQVFDGTRRRGLLVFAIPRTWAKRTFTLRSPFFPDLKLAPAKTAYAHPQLLVDRVDPPIDRRFQTRLAMALKEAIAQNRARLALHRPAAPADPGAPAQDVPVPPLDVAGAARLASVKSAADMQSLLQGLRWLPSPDDYWYYRHAPEAVLTQGWGDEGDLANLAGGLLARLGYSPALRAVTLTDAGRKALAALGHVDEAKERYLPAWAYTGAQGEPKLLVVPFMKDLSELAGLAFLPAGQEDRTMTAREAKIRVFFQVRPRGTRGLDAMAGSMADALTGTTAGPPKDKDVRVLRTSLPLDTLGRAPVDIRVGAQKGLYTAVLENRTLQVPGDDYVDPNLYTVTGARIEVDLPGRTLVHATTLQKGEDITGVFFTLGLNLPDLLPDAAAELQQAADNARHAVARPTVHSALAWYTRSILFRFLAGQSRYEADLARQLGVTVGRTERPRALLVTVQRRGDPARVRTSVDLMQSANDLHGGEPDKRHAFNLMSGMFASHLEGTALPRDGADFSEVWRRSPDDTMLFLSLPSRRSADLVYMQSHGMPATLIGRAKNSKQALLLPSKPTRIYGEDRWTWLEIDPHTFETIALTDTGEHGSFADYVMAMEPIAPASGDYLEFMAGAFVGVDTSVWSISSFSLETSDYDKVYRAAKAYTYAIAQVLDGIMTRRDLVKLEYSIGPLKLSIKPEMYDGYRHLMEEARIGYKPAAGADLLNFSTGFKAGAAWYFAQAKPSTPPPH